MFFVNLLTFGSAQTINHDFTYCMTESVKRVLDYNIKCNAEHMLDKYDDRLSKLDFWVISKRNYIINDYGYHCFQTKITKKLSWYFVPSQELHETEIQLNEKNVFS